MGRLQIFFPFCWLPFYSNDSFFCCAEALYYTWIPFVKFGFCCQCFWCVSHEVLAHAYVLMVLSKFSSRVFMVLGLMFKSLIHLELIFVLSVKKGSSFSFLLMASQFSQHHLLNRESFSHGLFCQVCERSDGCRYVALLLRPLFCSIVPYLCFGTTTMLF